MGLSPTDIFATFELEHAKGIVAAVSGGSDSLALLFLLKDYLATLDNPPPLIAVTIDHQLRDEAAHEASEVGAICNRHGIRHRILRWDDAKPRTGLASAARSARYRLLVQAAQDFGADYIATGHTRDDQIETFLMRKERSANPQARGLAAMATRSRLENSVILVRPLLDVSRAELRLELNRRSQVWFDDPSNVNTNYERPRVRLTSAVDADPDQILAQIASASVARQHDNATLVAAIAHPDSVKMDPLGTISVDAATYASMPENVRCLFAGLLVSIAGGRRFLPGDAERKRIEKVLLGNEKSSRLTVFGSLVECGRHGRWHQFRRERRNLDTATLAPGQAIIWDGRFRVQNASNAVYHIAAPDRQELIDFIEADNRSVDFGEREKLLVLPALYLNGKLVHVPTLEGQQLPLGITFEKHFAIFDHVLPGYDFALAKAIETRFGRKYPNFYKPVS